LYVTDALEFYLGFGPEIDGLLDEDDADGSDEDDEDAGSKKKGKKDGDKQTKIGADGKPEDCKNQ